MNNFEENKYVVEENQDNNNIQKKKKSNRSKNKSKTKDATSSKRRRKGIASFFLSLADRIEKGLQNGFFGYLFGDLYTKSNEKWKNGFIYQLFKRGKRKARSHATAAKLYEESLTYRIISWISDKIIHSYMRIWGIGLFSFAFAIIFAAMMRNYFTSEPIQERVIVGIVIAVISLPFLASKKRFGEAILSGKLSGFIVTQILNVDETKLEYDASHSGGSYLIAFELATGLGFCTYFLHPITVINILILVIVFSMIMCFPELGIITVLASIPFVNIFENPSMVIFTLIMFSVMGFISKFIRGKRVMRFELIDVFVLIFGALIMMGGIFSRGGRPSLYSAGMYFAFLCIYFLIVNSYIRKTWIYRGIKLIAVTTSLVALVGILEGGVINSSWVDMSMFADIGARVSSFLGNPNMLGAYLVIVFPFVLAQMTVSKKRSRKVFYFICSLIVFACTVMTWSRGAWLGIAVSLLIFMLVYNFRNIWLVVIGGLSIPAWKFLLPENIMDRLASIFTMSDSSVTYRFNTWKGVLKMIENNILTGVGVGESAFKSAYAQYAVPGTETVMHSHSLFLQVLLELGIIGLVVFSVVLFMYVQKCFVGVKNKNRGSKSRSMISAGLASVFGALTVGLTDHIWYNYRVFLIFWIAVALTVSLTRINEKERLKEKESARAHNNVRSADLDIYC